MKIKKLLMAALLSGSIFYAFVTSSFCTKFPNLSPTGPSEGHTLATYIRNTQHRHSCYASYKQLPKSRCLQSDEG